ncbi:MAG: retroviral-like aspartic protease family protein [Oscillospiraceae bacterium]|nr:retroviral-like aspartic protease family protein [Oscillospiraceae bacterium]
MKPIAYAYSPWNYAEFTREKGHMLVDIHVFSHEGTVTKMPFIVDSGAYITVLTRLNAQLIGLPLTGEYTVNLTGFNKERGSDKAEIVVVPKIAIGKHTVENVQILVPLEDIEIAEVLGENVLEYFNYTVDHDTDRVYFAKNPNPKPYRNSAKGIDLSCGRVLAQE